MFAPVGFIYFERQTGKDPHREKENEPCRAPVPSPHAQQCWHCARSSPGAGSSVQVSPMGGRASSPGVCLCRELELGRSQRQVSNPGSSLRDLGVFRR